MSTNADSAVLQRCLDELTTGLVNIDVTMLYHLVRGIQIEEKKYLVATGAGTKDLKHGFVPVQPTV